jgi:hypothetical protein
MEMMRIVLMFFGGVALLTLIGAFAMAFGCFGMMKSGSIGSTLLPIAVLAGLLGGFASAMFILDRKQE